MNKPIVLRIYSHEGRQRITVNAADTFGELLLNVCCMQYSFPNS